MTTTTPEGAEIQNTHKGGDPMVSLLWMRFVSAVSRAVLQAKFGTVKYAPKVGVAVLTVVPEEGKTTEATATLLLLEGVPNEHDRNITTWEVAPFPPPFTLGGEGTTDDLHDKLDESPTISGLVKRNEIAILGGTATGVSNDITGILDLWEV